MRDWGVKLGAVLLAAALWFHAVTERTYRLELDIPLVVQDPEGQGPESDIVLSSAVPRTVRVAITGGGKDLLRASPDDFTLRVVPPQASPGRRVTLRLEPGQVEAQAELGLSVDEVVDPRELSVLLDERVDRRVPVRARVGLRLSDSYTQVGGLQLDADSVDIAGPRTQVHEIEAIVTDSLFLEDVRETVDHDLDLLVPAGGLVRLQRERVSLHVDVQELAEYEIPNVPVAVAGGPPTAMAEPSRVTVRVRGGADLIGSLDPESDLGLTVAYVGLDSSLEIRAPEGRLYEVRQIIPPRATVVLRSP